MAGLTPAASKTPDNPSKQIGPAGLLRKLWLLSLLLLFYPSPSKAVPAFQQICSNGRASGAGTLSCNLTIAANHFFAAAVQCYAGCQLLPGAGFNDTFGLTWNLLSKCSFHLGGPSNQNTMLLWALSGSNSGSDTFTVTGPVSGVGETVIFVAEYSGVKNSLPLDGENCGTGAGGTPSSGNFTTTVTGDLIVGLADTGPATTAGASFTQRATQLLGAYIFEDKIAGAPGTYDANYTAGPTGWLVNGAAFLAATPKIRIRAQVIRYRTAKRSKVLLANVRGSEIVGETQRE